MQWCPGEIGLGIAVGWLHPHLRPLNLKNIMWEMAKLMGNRIKDSLSKNLEDP